MRQDSSPSFPIKEHECCLTLKFLERLKRSRQLSADHKLVLWDIREQVQKKHLFSLLYDATTRSGIMERTNLKEATIDRCVNDLVLQGLLLADPADQTIKVRHPSKISLCDAVRKGTLPE